MELGEFLYECIAQMNSYNENNTEILTFIYTSSNTQQSNKVSQWIKMDERESLVQSQSHRSQGGYAAPVVSFSAHTISVLKRHLKQQNKIKSLIYFL